MTARHQDYISETKSAVKSLWDSLHKLHELQTEYHALDYTNSLSPGIGSNEGITVSNISSAIFDTTNALTAVLFDTAHKTNFAKLL